MLLYKTPLRVFLRNEGTFLGLMSWPTSSKTALKEIKSIDIGTLNISEAIVSGFENFVPVVYKRYLFGASCSYSLSRNIETGQENTNTPCDFSRTGEPVIQWVTLPFYSRRRLEDYLLPADPKITILKKINRRYVEMAA
jgi:hypothetical protein